MRLLLAAALKWLIGLLGKYGGPLVAQALLFFGLSFVGYHYATPQFIAVIQSALSGSSGRVLSIIAFLNFDKAITIVLSAHAAKALTRFAIGKKPASAST